MTITVITNAYVRMSMLLFASRPLMLSPSPLHWQLWSLLIHFQESWPALSGPQQDRWPVNISLRFHRSFRAEDGAAALVKLRPLTLLTEHCCVVRQGQGFIEDQRWVRQEWQKGCSMISNESGWQRSRSSTVPFSAVLSILRIDGQSIWNHRRRVFICSLISC